MFAAAETLPQVLPAKRKRQTSLAAAFAKTPKLTDAMKDRMTQRAQRELEEAESRQALEKRLKEDPAFREEYILKERMAGRDPLKGRKCYHGKYLCEKCLKGYCRKHKIVRSFCKDPAGGAGGGLCKHKIQRSVCKDPAWGGGGSLC